MLTQDNRGQYLIEGTIEAVEPIAGEEFAYITVDGERVFLFDAHPQSEDGFYRLITVGTKITGKGGMWLERRGAVRFRSVTIITD